VSVGDPPADIDIQARPTSSFRQAYAHSIVGTAVIAAMGVCSGVLTARLLGPVARGQLAMLMLLPSLTIRIGNLGLTQAIAHLINPVRCGGRAVGPNAIVLALLLGCAECCIGIPLLDVALPNLPAYDRSAALILMLLVPATYVIYVLIGVDLGHGRFLRYSLYQALPVVLYVPILLALALAGKTTARTFALANLWAWLLVVGVRAPEALHLLLSGPVRIGDISRILISGFNLALPELAGLALLRMDYPILVRMVPADELGYYAVALAVGAGQSATANPVAQVCFHATSSATDRRDGLEMLAGQFRLLQPVFLLITIGSMLVVPFLIKVAFGTQFLKSTTTAYWLIAAMSLWSCSQVLDHGLRGLGRGRLAAWSNIMGLGLILSAGPLLVARFGITGMGAAMCLAQAVSLAAKLLLLNRGNTVRATDFWGLNRPTLMRIVTHLGIVWRSRVHTQHHTAQ